MTAVLPIVEVLAILEDQTYGALSIQGVTERLVQKVEPNFRFQAYQWAMETPNQQAKAYGVSMGDVKKALAHLVGSGKIISLIGSEAKRLVGGYGIHAKGTYYISAGRAHAAVLQRDQRRAEEYEKALRRRAIDIVINKDDVAARIDSEIEALRLSDKEVAS